MNLTLKNVKVSERFSEETTFFSASMYVDGKPVGTVANRGQGGCHEYHWTNPAIAEKLTEYAKNLPPAKGQFGELSYDLDMLVDDQISLWERHKMCKNAVVFRFKEDHELMWRMVKFPKNEGVWTPAHKSALLKQYGDKITEFLNETLYGPPQ